MKFSKIVGKIEPKVIQRAEEMLTKVFLELGSSYTNTGIGTKLGGDPLMFALLYPMQHVATTNLKTAATDGKRFYWNPYFVLSLTRRGVRLLGCHEPNHCLYLHMSRRGSRNPKLWNICVDYLANGNILNDLAMRKLDREDPSTIFRENLGRFYTVDNFLEKIKNPMKPIPGFEDLEEGAPEEEVVLPHPLEDVELTEEQRNFLGKKKKMILYADPNLKKELRSPEKLYDLFYEHLPKCPDCGKLGVYSVKDLAKKLKEGSKEKQQNKEDQDKKEEQENNKEEQQEQEGQADKENQQSGQQPEKDRHEGHDHNHDEDTDNNSKSDKESNKSGGDEDGNKPGTGQGKKHGKGCGTCSDMYDVFGFAETLDDHMDSEESEEVIIKRFKDAIESAKRMAGHVPAALEEELGKLIKPKMSWQDIVRLRISRSKDGNARNDWNRFRTRPLFYGSLVPKKKGQTCKFLCLLDTSGSMSKDDMAFGISQLASLDHTAEGIVVPADADIYWDQATEINSISEEDLSKIKIVGRGGTKYAEFFDQYTNHFNNIDFIIIITDGYLDKYDMDKMISPTIDVVWLITSESDFEAPFGKVFKLKD